MGLLPVLDLRKVAVHFTLASFLLCNLYGRDLDLLPLRLPGPGSSASSSRDFIAAAVVPELDAVKLHDIGH